MSNNITGKPPKTGQAIPDDERSSNHFPICKHHFARGAKFHVWSSSSVQGLHISDDIASHHDLTEYWEEEEARVESWLRFLLVTTKYNFHPTIYLQIAYPVCSFWWIEINDLTQLVTAYQQRKFDEDVSYLENELGGTTFII